MREFDQWLQGRDVAALAMRQELEPAEGPGAVIFPPTYAKPQGVRDEDWTGYNIDRFPDGSSVCQIDSVGSQANRMEPLFKKEPLVALVPQVAIRVGGQTISLLDAGHRAADAVVRYSSLAEGLENAFWAWMDGGNAEPLARIAPTSIVFGAWDSRGTQAKLPRIVRSVVRAFDVDVLHRSAQYVPAADYVLEGVVDEPAKNARKQDQDAHSELGLSHAPATWAHGGVIARSGIRRSASINIETIRSLGAAGDADALRSYIFGLALVALASPQQTSLREGCQLVPAEGCAPHWELVRHDGTREAHPVDADSALAYAQAAASAFGVGESLDEVFDSAKASKELKMSADERKRARARGRARGASAGE